MLWFNVAHIKNCEPLVSFPRLAMDKRKALSCLRTKFSSVGSRDRGVDISAIIPTHIRRHIQGGTGQRGERA